MQDHRRHGGRAEGGRGRMSRHGETVNSEAMVEAVSDERPTTNGDRGDRDQK